MKNKILRSCSVILLLVICIMEFSIFSEATTLDEELLQWGFRRGENHNQPTLDPKPENYIRKYNGISMGNKNDQNVYLTFDSGYEAGYTEKILDVLRENNVKATFFITAHYLNTAENLVKRMIEEGHIVGNHTVNHKCMPKLSENEMKDEVMKMHNAVFEKFGYEMKYFRPPKGEFSEKVIKNVNDMGYRTVLWSLAYDDWDKEKQNREEYAINKIMDNLHNGAVILLHSTSKDNANILNELINKIRNEGYKFKSIEEFDI